MRKVNLLLASFVFLVLALSTVSAASLFSYDTYRDNDYRYTDRNSASNADYYKESRDYDRYTSTVDDEEAGYHRTIETVSENTNIESRNYPDTYNYNYYYNYPRQDSYNYRNSYSNSDKYPKPRYIQYDNSYDSRRPLTCEVYSDKCKGQKTNFGFRPVYSGFLDGKGNTYTGDYYYEPKYDKKLGYYNWNF